MADNNLKNLITQSDFLKNVDVSTIISSLAIGIAEAQERLDENSINQISKLTEIEVAGMSLLELGFKPTFYAFEHADISASIQLKMAVSQTIDVSLSLSAEYENNADFDKDFFDKLEKDKQKSLYNYSSNSQSFSSDTKTSTKVTINDRDIDIHTEQGSISKVEKAQEQMSEESTGTRVDSIIVDDEKALNVISSNDISINKENGYVVIAIPEDTTDTIGLLKMDSDYTTPDTISLDSSPVVNFSKEIGFGKTFQNAIDANLGLEIGIVNSKPDIADKGIYRKGTSSGQFEFTPFDFYFGFNMYNINFDSPNNTTKPSLKKDDFEKIAFLLAKDRNLKINIKGYTDGVGTNEYNIELSKKRIQSIKEYFQNLAKKIGGNSVVVNSQIIPKPLGEKLADESGDPNNNPDFRKITIEFDTTDDYIHFEGGKIGTTATPDDSSSNPNKFIFLDAQVSYTADEIHFEYGGETVEINASSLVTFTQFVNESVSKVESFYFEKKNGLFYLLHEETQIHYSVFSLEEKEIEVKINDQSVEEIDTETTSVYLSEKESKKSRLKNDTKKVDGDRSLAVSGSIDARYSRQFGVSMEGNAAISARIVALPPPSGLEQYLNSLITPGIY